MIAIRYSERAALAVSRPMAWFIRIFRPLIASSMALLASSCACCASSRSAVTERYTRWTS